MNISFLYFINSLVLLILTLNTINFLNLFLYYAIKYLSLGIFIYILIVIFFIVNIYNRLTNLNNMARKSIKIDKAYYDKFASHYLTAYAVNFKMTAMVFVNLFNELNKNSLSLELFALTSIVILLILYFLTSEIVINKLFQAWVSIHILTTAVDDALKEWSQTPNESTSTKAPKVDLSESPSATSYKTPGVDISESPSGAPLSYLFRKYGAVSVQMTINTLPSNEFPRLRRGRWSSITLGWNSLYQIRTGIGRVKGGSINHYTKRPRVFHWNWCWRIY